MSLIYSATFAFVAEKFWALGNTYNFSFNGPDDIKSRLPFDSSTLDYYSRHILYRLGKHREQDSKTQNEKTWNGSNGSSQGSTISLNEWMTRLPSELRSKPIWSLTLPGSHDSGAYALETKDGIAPDKDDLKKKWWMKYFSILAYPIIKKWTVTQKVDIRTQLENGIRYFDFRAAPKSKPGDNDLYFVHGLYGPKIISMCSDIKDFLDEHQKEVVIIHIQHFIGTKPQQEKDLLDDLLRIFDAKICPYHKDHKSEPTLDQLNADKKQIFLFYPSESSVRSQYLWPPKYLPNPWANTTKTQYLLRFLNHRVHQRECDRFFVTQGVLTPDDSFVRRHLLSSLQKRLVQPCNQTLCEWLKDQRAGPKGPNIVMTDFVEWNNFQIPKCVIQMNYTLLNHHETDHRNQETEKMTATRTESMGSTDSGYSEGGNQ